MGKLCVSIILSNFILLNFCYSEENSEMSKEKFLRMDSISQVLNCQLTSGKMILIGTCVATCSWPCRAAILILPLSRIKRPRDIFISDERRQHKSAFCVLVFQTHEPLVSISFSRLSFVSYS